MSDMGAPAAPAAAPSAPSSTPASPSPKSSPSMNVPQGSAKAPPTGSAPASTTTSNSPSPGAGPKTSEEYFEVKVMGKPVKMTRQEVIDNASMYLAAHQKFNEASKLRQQSEAWQEKVKTDFITALQDPSLGLTKDQIRDRFEKWYMEEFVEPEKLNADQKRALAAERELQKYKQQEEQQKAQREQDEMQKLTTQQRDYLQKQIIEAMETSGLPKTKFFASRMAFYMRQNLANGWEAPLSMIVQQVKNERSGIMSDLSEGATVEQLISLLGEGVINKIRQHDLQKLRERKQNKDFGHSSPNEPPALREDKIDFNDVNKRLRDMRIGKMTF